MGTKAPLLVSAFGSEQALQRTLDALRSAGVGEIETYTPTPVRAPTDVSLSGPAGAVAGLAGVAGAFAMQVYANLWGYPLDIGGRPYFSWPSFAPIALEVGILFAVLGVFVYVFVTAPLLQLYAPIDDCDLIRRSSSDRWVVAISATEPDQITHARDICARLGALEIEDIS